MRRRSGARSLAAVLFTDIVDSTAHARRIGDLRWKELIGRHHAIVRGELKHFGGRELDTAGDGFFASFSEPAAAIRCACAISESVRLLGIEIRAGVHFGECEQVGSKLGGLTVVVGARVMSLGGAGDVLITGSTRELVGGADLGFEERGRHVLKGVDGEWQVFAVTEVDGVPRPRPSDAHEAERLLDAVQPASAIRRPAWKPLAIVSAFLVVAAVVVPALVRNTDAGSEIAPNSIGVLDPESGEVVATMELEERPGSVAASADAVWVTNPAAGTITQIDPVERAVRDSINVGENPTGMAVGFDALWVVESGGPSVSRISSANNDVVATIDVGNGPAGIAVGEGSVWVTNRFDGTISRIDPDGVRANETIPVGLDPRGIVVGFGSVWVALAGSNTVVRVDPDTNSVTQPIGVGNAPGSMAVSRGPDALWVVNSLDSTVMQISPDTNTVVDTIEVGKGPGEIAVVDGIVWVANEADGTLSRIEPGQAPVRTMTVGSVPQGLASVDGDLWVSVRGTATSHRGGTLRMLSLSEPRVDPVLGYDHISWRILHLLGDGLVAFEPIGGTGAALVPDLATSIPNPTEGGRTYAFELRPGIRYSTGEVVMPSDFRRALERGFRFDPIDYPTFYGGLVGGTACEMSPRTCDLSEGIVTDDESGALTFHLTKPDAEFRFKLTMPFAYPVPPSVQDERRKTAGVPGTGPYMLEAPMTDEGLALVRNPRFRVWSAAAQPDGYVDRIEWTFGIEPEAQVEAVAAGDADLAVDAATSGRLEDISVRFAAQVHTSPDAFTFFAVLNGETPPFDDVDVRRAFNLAVDRDRVVQIFGGERAALPACQQLPPNFPGYEPYCPYTIDPGPEGSWTAPDPVKARNLVSRSGTAGMRVVVELTPFLGEFADMDLMGDYLVELLNELGYRGIVKTPTVTHFYSADTEFQMAVDGWGADYPAASNFITNRFMCVTNWAPAPGLCEPRIDAMIERATRIQTDNPAASAALWAAIDRAIADQASYMWLVNRIGVEFVSERADNYQWSLQWGVLLNQLWVR